jgi:hypothetical protein
LTDVGYEPAPESKTPLNMRAPKSLVASLDEIVKLWKLQAIARGEDPTNIDRTHVAVTLLKTATAGEFDAYGGRPKDEDGWDAIKKAIGEGVVAVRSIKPKK